MVRPRNPEWSLSRIMFLMLMVEKFSVFCLSYKKNPVAKTVVEYFFELFWGVMTDAKENFVGGRHRAYRRF
jgi:hypothetical protein